MEEFSFHDSNKRSSPCVFKKGDMVIGNTFFPSDPILGCVEGCLFDFKYFSHPNILDHAAAK